MYFPFVYGRRSEFLALRAMLKDHRSLATLVPVIEPVNRNSSDLIRCMNEFGKAEQALAVILNPDKHELKSENEAKAWLEEVRKVVDEHQSILPTFRSTPTTTLAEISSFIKRFAGRNVALAYSSPALTDAEIKKLAADKNVRFHIVLNDKMTTTQQNLLPFDKRVDICDYFNKLDRNSDYTGAEFFNDRHKTFKPSWAGFGDYAAIGTAFTPGGSQPAAVAIHATYKHKTGDVWIEHFVSDDTDKDVGSTEEKFLQAAIKLVNAAKARPNEFGKNFALDTYADHVAANHFPGLGTNKVLQLEHHICLMLDLLDGTL